MTAHARLEKAIQDYVAEELGKPDFVTEWVVVAATAVPDNHKATGYVYVDSELPYHHAVGLLNYGLEDLATDD